MHIALLGGSFDPLHNGHLHIASCVKKSLPHIDVVHLLPCFSHPFDKKMSSSKKRLAMCQLAKNKFIKVNDHEIAKKGTSYTIDTLNELSKKNPQNTYYFILGSDQLSNFHKWKDYKTLKSQYNLIIFPRETSGKNLLALVKKTLQLTKLTQNIYVLKAPPFGVSSTAVRERVRKNTSIKNLVPESVKTYILHNNMYKVHLPPLNVKNEIKTITAFLKKVFKETEINSAVIGISGGVDSAVSFALLTKVLSPKNIHVAHLYYHAPDYSTIKKMIKTAGVPQSNQHFISIKKLVDEVVCTQKIKSNDKLRIGNIAARVRMIMLFDLAKKHGGLVCGTENKSENKLGYFTRFGDAASDIEPISHLYKTHVYELTRELAVPTEILTVSPSANLWDGQTDEGEFGFSYEEADQVLYLYFDKKKKLKEIEKLGFKNAKKIIEWTKRMDFKHHVPYTLSPSK